MIIQDINAIKNAYKPNFDFIADQGLAKQNFNATSDATKNSTYDVVDIKNAEKPSTETPSAEQTKEQEKLAKAEEQIQKQKEELAQKQAEMEQLKADFEAAKKEAEAVKEAFDVLIKCIKISGNIISGNNVPAADHKFLMENDHELYMMSVTCALPNDDPKDLKQVTEKEKSHQSEVQISSTPTSGQVAEMPKAEPSVGADSISAQIG